VLVAGHRADDRRWVARIAERYARDGVPEDVDHRVVDLRGDEQPRSGHAELTGVEDEGLDHGAHGDLDVGVGEDQVRTVAAELHGDRLQVLARDARGPAAHGRRSGERDLVDSGVP